MTEDPLSRPVIDHSAPTIARCYDFSLGGKDNFEIDRAAMAVIEEHVPEAAVLARVNRAWHIRATRFVATQAGITQHLDLGAGLPTVENTHEVVHRSLPDARIVYVDNDPSAVAHGRALLDDNNLVRYVEGDLTKPTEILADPVTSTHLDLTEPIVLYHSATLHHQPDEGLPELMRTYVDALAPGSFVVLSHFWDPGGEAGKLVHRIREVMLTLGMDGAYFRSREQILEFLPGLELLPGNPDDTTGLVPQPQWWPDGPGSTFPGLVPGCIVGAVGRKN
ncbi:SAM-dependent methyltransferase [Pseudonocardia nematodicida]|uniref:SAM-dependent methyltransferase n=1 Tax=Pseudonocardia nematodicida TaxID=1206997 RepID=A0ABV1KBA6_9PSEU